MRKSLFALMIVLLTLSAALSASAEKPIPFDQMRLVYNVETTYALKYRTGISAAGSIALAFHDVSTSSSKVDVTVEGTMSIDSEQQPIRLSSTVDLPTDRDTLVYLRNGGQSALTIYAGPTGIAVPDLPGFTVDLTRTWYLHDKPTILSALSPTGSLTTYRYRTLVQSVPAPGGGTVDLEFYASYETNTQILVKGEVWAIDKSASASILKLELREINLPLSTSSSCVIATAAYGSELATPVRLLRDFRDQKIQTTHVGSIFMKAFNRWYYGWAPSVARSISGPEISRRLVQVTIAPLIGVLILTHNVFDGLSLNNEIAAVLSGLVAATLIGISYLALPMYLIAPLVESRLSSRRQVH